MTDSVVFIFIFFFQPGEPPLWTIDAAEICWFNTNETIHDHRPPILRRWGAAGSTVCGLSAARLDRNVIRCLSLEQ